MPPHHLLVAADDCELPVINLSCLEDSDETVERCEDSKKAQWTFGSGGRPVGQLNERPRWWKTRGNSTVVDRPEWVGVVRPAERALIQFSPPSLFTLCTLLSLRNHHCTSSILHSGKVEGRSASRITREDVRLAGPILAFGLRSERASFGLTYSVRPRSLGTERSAFGDLVMNDENDFGLMNNE
ncbi:hypothetical protein LR48_Vigan07g213600 [Vigna angularis]|uniref:Uncharacterized protein n=1 Tax=Phaseolus angularis TaxID=3914 RepID=A0A0L9V0P0_PHAAN|nr:hypothetical protein LR48_Vigan07g213600 [Vigna angularis]